MPLGRRGEEEGMHFITWIYILYKGCWHVKKLYSIFVYSGCERLRRDMLLLRYVNKPTGWHLAVYAFSVMIMMVYIVYWKHISLNVHHLLLCHSFTRYKKTPTRMTLGLIQASWVKVVCQVLYEHLLLIRRHKYQSLRDCRCVRTMQLYDNSIIVLYVQRYAALLILLVTKYSST